jgi:peptide/nickel transport system substrate-binding protein
VGAKTRGAPRSDRPFEEELMSDWPADPVDENPRREEFGAAHPLTRRQLLRRAAVGGVMLGLPVWPSVAEAADRRLAAIGAVRGGVLKMARNEEAQSFDPVVPGDNGSIYSIQQIFDQLTRLNHDSTFIVPGLAESWQISADRLTYTFKLRSGARFSNGAPVTADDVLFSLGRTFNPKTCFYSFLFGSVKSMRKLDSKTIQLKLSEPNTPLLESLSVFAAAIVPEAVVKKDPKGFGQRPVGSGAFALKQFSKGQFTHLVRNPYYWQKGKPYLDEVMMFYVPDDNTRILKLQAGEVDSSTLIPYSQIAGLNKGKTRVQIEPLFRWDGIWLNHARKPINDKKVRQALNYATDKDALVSRVLFGHAQVANHMMPKHRYWRADVKPYPYDINKAKALMAQSSVPKGFNVNVIVPTGDTIVSQVAQVVKQAWSQIGVNITIQSLDAGTAATKWANSDFTVGSNWYVTSDVTAPDEPAGIEFDYGAPGGFHSAFANYKSAKASSLIHQAARSHDEHQRAQLFGQLQQLVMDDAYGVALFFSPARTGLRSNVHNFQTKKTGWWALEEVYLA